jgi:hypothetical protein
MILLAFPSIGPLLPGKKRALTRPQLMEALATKVSARQNIYPDCLGQSSSSLEFGRKRATSETATSLVGAVSPALMGIMPTSGSAALSHDGHIEPV